MCNDIQLSYHTVGASNAVQVILGGSRFNKTTLGESRRYLLTSFKGKFFEPLVGQMVEQIFENEMEMKQYFGCL